MRTLRFAGLGLAVLTAWPLVTSAQGLRVVPRVRVVAGVRFVGAPPPLRAEARPTVSPSTRHLWIAGYWALRAGRPASLLYFTSTGIVYFGVRTMKSTSRSRLAPRQ